MSNKQQPDKKEAPDTSADPKSQKKPQPPAQQVTKVKLSDHNRHKYVQFGEGGDDGAITFTSDADYFVDQELMPPQEACEDQTNDNAKPDK